MTVLDWEFGGQLKVILNPTTQTLSFTGVIDKSFDHQKLTLDEGIKALEIDLKNLSYMNSYGVREFIAWIASISLRMNVSYINCPVSFVHQANMVAGIIKKNVSIESFYAPYFNELTQTEVELLLRSDDIVASKIPSQENLVFDWDEKNYLSFIDRQNKL